ncbi:MAG: DUF1624 domain-containing protein [Methanomicrobiales archaeon]|nr:DUF1624 domain-containing protein [Methanomicrobiales archaeon]
MQNQKKARFWEIDALRGCAILMMITYHVLYDLWFFGLVPVNVHTGFWRYWAFSTAGLFLFLVGVSLTISRSRYPGAMPAELYRKFAVRGAGLFLLGMGITAVTWIYPGRGFILFGILHSIGLSIIIAPLFFRLRRANLVLGALVIAAGGWVASIEGPLWLLWIGIHPATFVSFDYEPLVPWFGVVLLGLYAGATVFPDGRRRIRFPTIAPLPVVPLCMLGRHSLLLYILHQPVIIAILYLLAEFGGIFPGYPG